MQSTLQVDFVEPPPRQFQIECAICLELLREPQIVSCCGNSFCLVCIGRIRRDSRPCPLCQRPHFTIMANQGLERALYDFQVRCPHRHLGCTWQGELRSLRPHLNVPSDRQTPSLEVEAGCPFTTLSCAHCGGPVQRRALENHQNDRCPLRPYTCEHCGGCTGTFEAISSRHWPRCQQFPLPCPNTCASSDGSIRFIERGKLDDHIMNECPLEIVECDLRHVGCMAEFQRKDRADHMREEALTHMSLLAIENFELSTKLQDKGKEQQLLSEAYSELRVDMEEQYDKLFSQNKKITSLTAEFHKMKQDLQNLQTAYLKSIEQLCKLQEQQKASRKTLFWQWVLLVMFICWYFMFHYYL